jgi:hypothetical protein
MSGLWLSVPHYIMSDHKAVALGFMHFLFSYVVGMPDIDAQIHASITG